MKRRRFQTDAVLLEIAMVCVFCAGMATSCVPVSSLSVKVLDEDGHPVQGATVGIVFEVREKETQKKGSTDEDGVFSASGRTSGYISSTATKKGCYPTDGKPVNLKPTELGTWKPMFPQTVLVLKKIGSPVPMYAREAHINLPVLNKEVGYDLMEADWVMPYGKGRNSDFIFKGSKRFTDELDFEATVHLTFSHKGDGIQDFIQQTRYGSELALPRYAPEEGYIGQLSLLCNRSPKEAYHASNKTNQHYFFRVRSENQNGVAQKALYGKIRDGVKIFATGTRTVEIVFEYYLNPDGTRNMEFDPKRNLFKKLKILEEVQHP